MHHTIPRLDNTLPINYTEYDTSTLEAELMERKQQCRLLDLLEYIEATMKGRQINIRLD